MSTASTPRAFIRSTLARAFGPAEPVSAVAPSTAWRAASVPGTPGSAPRPGRRPRRRSSRGTGSSRRARARRAAGGDRSRRCRPGRFRLGRSATASTRAAASVVTTTSVEVGVVCCRNGPRTMFAARASCGTSRAAASAGRRGERRTDISFASVSGRRERAGEGISAGENRPRRVAFHAAPVTVGGGGHGCATRVDCVPSRALNNLAGAALHPAAGSPDATDAGDPRALRRWRPSPPQRKAARVRPARRLGRGPEEDAGVLGSARTRTRRAASGSSRRSATSAVGGSSWSARSTAISSRSAHPRTGTARTAPRHIGEDWTLLALLAAGHDGDAVPPDEGSPRRRSARWAGWCATRTGSSGRGRGGGLGWLRPGRSGGSPAT